jgi:hypothetical protein
VASGLPNRPIPEERVPLFEAFGCGEQTIRSITRGEPAKLDYEMNQKCRNRLADFVFLNGRRPYDELKADLQRCLKWTRSGALIAWDGIRPFGADETSLSGGMRLWQELQPRFPQHAEYLSGTSLPCGGIAAIVAK